MILGQLITFCHSNEFGVIIHKLFKGNNFVIRALFPQEIKCDSYFM